MQTKYSDTSAAKVEQKCQDPIYLYLLIMILTNYRKMFHDKLKDIRIQIRLWNYRGLSLFGKVTAVIKSLLLPKMLYVFSVLTTPEEFRKQSNTTDKLARLAAVNDLKYGGLNLIDLETYVKSSRLA